MSEAPPTRRWFQFSLGTMLWLALVIALIVYGVNEHRLRMQAETEARIFEASANQLVEVMTEFSRAVEAHGWNRHTEEVRAPPSEGQ